MKSKFIFSIVILAIAFVSCKKDAEVPVYSDFPEPIGKIFSNKCATSGCHNNASYEGASNLNLTSFQNLFKGSSVGSPVIPYRSDFSSLLSFVNTYSDLGLMNGPTMPLNSVKLTKEEVTTIKNWIDIGAPDKDGTVMWQENPDREKYYVVNQGCDVVTVFDAKTQLPMRYITVGKLPNVAELPHMIKTSPDGKYWYVVFVNANMLQKYSASNDQLIAEVDLGKDNSNQPFNQWNTLTISDDGKRAYCVSWQQNSRIASVNLETMSLIQNLAGTTNAHGIALNKTNDTLYVTSQYGNFIYKIDTDFTSIQQVTLDMSTVPSYVSNTLDPHEIIFSDDGSKYFVTCQASNQVRVMSTATGSLLQIISTGQYPLEAVKSNAQKLYVTCENQPNSSTPNQKGCVTVIDMNTFSATNYPVGYQPHGIAVDEKNGYLVVASRNILVSGPTPHHTSNCGRNGFVNFFNLQNMQLLKKQIEVASDPYSVAFRP